MIQAEAHPLLLARAFAALGLVALGAACGRAPARPPVARNLLLITIDTLRADHLSCYGYSRPTSPNIDRLAEEGVLFERVHSVASWTLPSIVSILTSRYPSAHGCQGDRSSLPGGYATLAETLRDAGFRTAAVTSHLYLRADRGLDQGFEHYDDELVEESRGQQHTTVTSPAITDKAIAWLDERSADRAERWFLWLHYFDPHSRYMAHPGITEAYGQRGIDHYDGEITFTDRHLGRLFDHLAELGLAEETIVVLTADHGEEFMDHGGQGHRKTLYEEVLRIPLIVRAPGIAARRSAGSAGSIDVLPTVCELLDVRSPADIQGQTLVPPMRGLSDEPRSRLAEMRNDNHNDWDGLVEGRFKLLHDVTNDRQLLFDLDTDPHERSDLAPARSELVAALGSRMRAMIALSRQRALQAGKAAEIELTPEEEESLEQLGYGGDAER